MRPSLRHTLLILTIAAPVLAAQQSAPKAADTHAHSARPTLDPEMAEHFKGIPLTDEQVQRITEINVRHHSAMEAVRKAAKDPNDAATKAAMQRHMDTEHAEFKALLSAEHAKLLDENMKAHHKADAAMDHGGMKHDKAVPPRKPW